jgi:hypothetical protein
MCSGPIVETLIGLKTLGGGAGWRCGREGPNGSRRSFARHGSRRAGLDPVIQTKGKQRAVICLNPTSLQLAA